MSNSNTELVLGIFGGTVAIIVALIGIVPKMKEISKNKQEKNNAQQEISLDKHPVFLELKGLNYFFRNSFKLKDEGRTEIVKDVMINLLETAEEILMRYAKKVESCNSNSLSALDSREVSELLFCLFCEVNDSIRRKGYREGLKSYTGKEYDEESKETLDICTDKLKEWNHTRIEIVQTASEELPKMNMNDSCYNVMWDMLSIYSYVFTQMKYDSVMTINRLDGELTGRHFLGIEIGDE